jgi:trehalose 6-phosphate phosphatase
MQQHLREDKALRGDNLSRDDLSRIERAASQRSGAERLLTAPAAVALYLDIDGTLLDVALTPSTVHVPADLSDLLGAISTRLSGALAIVTGRPIVEADHLLKPLKFAAAGVHGAEMRTSAAGNVVSLTPSFSPELISDIKSIAKSRRGIVVEDKVAGIALHYRIVPELHASLLHALEALSPRHPGQFMVCGGRKVVEILPIGFSKGRALRQLAALPNFSNRVPVMIGDDIADLDAFRAAEEMGGYGLKVAGENFSEAEAAFRSPTEVLGWLRSFGAGL